MLHLCQHCGKAFQRSRASGGIDSAYCSDECTAACATHTGPRQLPLFELRRRCRRCGRTKALKYFREGRFRCLRCEATLQRKYAAQHREQCRAAHARYRLANREKRAAYNQAWFAAHPGYLEHHNKTYGRTHRDEIRANERRRRQRYPERVHAQQHRREARLAGAAGSWTAEEWRALKEYYAYTCLMCGRKEPEIKLTFDHVIPLARGGANTIDNAQPLCLSCNCVKHDKTLDLRPRWHGASPV